MLTGLDHLALLKCQPLGHRSLIAFARIGDRAVSAGLRLAIRDVQCQEDRGNGPCGAEPLHQRTPGVRVDALAEEYADAETDRPTVPEPPTETTYAPACPPAEDLTPAPRSWTVLRKQRAGRAPERADDCARKRLSDGSQRITAPNATTVTTRTSNWNWPNGAPSGGRSALIPDSFSKAPRSG